MSDLTIVTTEKHYLAMIDSANLIINGKRAEQDESEWADVKKRNVDHLVYMLSKGLFSDYDLTLINQAITTG